VTIAANFIARATADISGFRSGMRDMARETQRMASDVRRTANGMRFLPPLSVGAAHAERFGGEIAHGLRRGMDDRLRDARGRFVSEDVLGSRGAWGGLGRRYGQAVGGGFSASLSTALGGLGTRLGATIRGELGTVGVAIGAALGVREIAQAADEYAGLTDRLRLVTTGSQDLARTQQRLFDLAQGTRIGLAETVNLYTRMARSTRALGLSQDTLLSVTRAVNQSVIVSGASASEAASGIQQFTQALQANRFQGDELRSVFENFPRLAEAIAAGLGVSLGQLREMGTQGKLTTAVLIDAIRTQAPQIEREFEQMNVRIGQSFTRLGNAFLRLVGEQDGLMGASRRVAGAINALADVLTNGSPLLSGLGQAALVAGSLTLAVYALERSVVVLIPRLLAGAVAAKGFMLSLVATPLGPVLAAIAAISAAVGVSAYNAKVATQEFERFKQSLADLSPQQQYQNLRRLEFQVSQDRAKLLAGGNTAGEVRDIQARIVQANQAINALRALGAEAGLRVTVTAERTIRDVEGDAKAAKKAIEDLLEASSAAVRFREMLVGSGGMQSGRDALASRGPAEMQRANAALLTLLTRVNAAIAAQGNAINDTVIRLREQRAEIERTLGLTGAMRATFSATGAKAIDIVREVRQPVLVALPDMPSMSAFDRGLLDAQGQLDRLEVGLGDFRDRLGGTLPAVDRFVDGMQQGVNGLASLLAAVRNPSSLVAPGGGAAGALGTLGNIAGLVGSLSTVATGVVVAVDFFTKGMRENAATQRQNTEALERLRSNLRLEQRGVGAQVDIRNALQETINTIRSRPGGSLLSSPTTDLTARLRAVGLTFTDVQQIAEEFGIKLADRTDAFEALAKAIDETIRATFQFRQTLDDQRSRRALRDDVFDVDTGAQATITRELTLLQQFAPQLAALFGTFDAATKEGRAQIEAGIRRLFTMMEQGLTPEQIGALGSWEDLLEIIRNTEGALDELSESSRAASDAMQSVPTGFRIAFRTLQAQNPRAPGAGTTAPPITTPGWTPQGGGRPFGGGQPFGAVPPVNFQLAEGAVVIQAADGVDGRQVWREMIAEARSLARANGIDTSRWPEMVT
jgi:tape measure domain-containing protein